MTEQEMAQIIGEAGTELAALKKQRACLQEKAERYLKGIKTAEGVLKRAQAPVEGSAPASVRKDLYPSVEDIEALYIEAERTATRIRELEDRMREWGVL